MEVVKSAVAPEAVNGAVSLLVEKGAKVQAGSAH